MKMNKLSIKEFGYKFQIPESTLRGWVAANKLVTDVQIIKKRKTTVILLDDKAAAAVSEYKGFVTSSDELNDAVANKQVAENDLDTSFVASDENIQDAEYEEIREVRDVNTNFNLVSLETTTIERMLDQIQNFAEERAKTLEDTNQQVHNELFELKAEIKTLRDENKSMLLKNAQLEVETNIKQKRVEELENDINKLNKKLIECEKELEYLKINNRTTNEIVQNKSLLGVLSTKL